MKKYDLLLVGGGIIGLATAYQISNEFPNLKVGLLEKEPNLATHQTGHNSGVIHSGIYYKPGSLKAKNCVRGYKMLLDFCEQNQIPYDLCGKLIVANAEVEITRLKELHKRGTLNGVKGLKMVDQSEVKSVEPEARAKLALHSPNTGIVDYKLVSKAIAKRLKENNVDILLNQEVTALLKEKESTIVRTKGSEFQAKYVICACGLYADTVAKSNNENFKEQIIPFRGEYFFLSKELEPQFKGLIYPVPDPAFPFLGVHLTKRMNGKIEIGPNAVLAFAKEGYKKSDIKPKEMGRYLGYSGFWSLIKRHWKIGCYEFYRSYFKSAFLKDIQKLVPSIQLKDLRPGGSGVRAQMVLPGGELCDDFFLKHDSKVLHVLNAPSPGATSCFSIGMTIKDAIKPYIESVYAKKI